MKNILEPELILATKAWQDFLFIERNYSKNTLEAYDNDILSFFYFLNDHLGYPPGFTDLNHLTTLDIRSFLSRLNANGLKRTSIARTVSALRNFFKST